MILMKIEEARKAKEEAEKKIEVIIAELESTTGSKVKEATIFECSDNRGLYRSVSLIIPL